MQNNRKFQFDNSLTAVLILSEGNTEGNKKSKFLLMQMGMNMRIYLLMHLRSPIEIGSSEGPTIMRQNCKPRQTKKSTKNNISMSVMNTKNLLCSSLEKKN